MAALRGPGRRRRHRHGAAPGSQEALAGEVAGQLECGEVLGLGCQVAKIRFAFDAAKLDLESLEVVEESGSVVLAGVVPLDGGPMDLELSSDLLDLGGAPFRDLLGGAVAGTMEISGHVGGPLEEPEVVIFAEGRGLAMGAGPR